MLAKADHYPQAYDDYLKALTIDPLDAVALDGFVTSAVILKKSLRGAGVVERYPAGEGTDTADWLPYRSCWLQTATGRSPCGGTCRKGRGAGIAIRHWSNWRRCLPIQATRSQLDAAVGELRKVAPKHAPTEFYAAVAAFLHGNAWMRPRSRTRQSTIDPNYARRPTI